MYYDNLLSAATFQGFDTTGAATGLYPIPSGQAYSAYSYRAGHATLTIGGTYTGTVPRDYIATVVSTTNGTFAGTLWKWSDDGGATYSTNLVPVSGVPVSLSHGVTLTWTASGSAPEIVAGDTLEWRQHRPHGLLNAFDGSRNTEYRSGALAATSTLRMGFNVGAGAAPGLLVVDDHNLPSDATVTLWGTNGTLYTEAGATSQAVTWRANRLVELITIGTRQYWWLKIVMGATALSSYLRISELFLGTGVTFEKPPIEGFDDTEDFLASLDVAETLTRGAGPLIWTAGMVQYTWPASARDGNADGGKLETVFAATTRHRSYRMKPFWFLLEDTQLADIKLYQWAGPLRRPHVSGAKRAYTASFCDVIRTVSL